MPATTRKKKLVPALLLVGFAGVGAYAYKRLRPGGASTDRRSPGAPSSEDAEFRSLQADHLVEGLDGDL